MHSVSSCQPINLSHTRVKPAVDGLGSFGYTLPMAAHDHDHKDGSDLSEMELRVRALQTILVEKGYVETAALDRIVEPYETKIGPHIGAQVIAKAWIDPALPGVALRRCDQGDQYART